MKAKRAWMVLAAAAVAASWGANEAEALTQTVNGLTWEYHVSNGQAAIFTGGRSPAIPRTTAGAITVPSRLGGYPVKRVGNAAFYGCDKLTSVTIPNGVTSIGELAFCACRKMTRVTIPASVTRIEREAFWKCESLKSVKIPAGVKRIEEGVFFRCRSLTNVMVPNGATSIGEKAFAECHGLTNVAIPPSVKSIGRDAFEKCSSLKSLAIPNGVTNIADWVFYGCKSLKSVSIPNSVKSIDAWAFGECSALTSVTIPESVTSIGNAAFESCTALKTATIFGNVSDDWDVSDAYWWCLPFSECTNLQTVVLGGRMTKIGSYMFYHCDGLKRVTIGSNVKSIGYGAFYGCDGVETLSVPASWEGTEKLDALRGMLPYACEVRYLPEQRVAFEPRGGSCGTASRLYVKSQPYGWLPSATRGGYAFAGWHTKATGGERVATASRATQEAARTLYAHWIKSVPQTVWRFHSKKHKGHFYTISAVEKAKLMASNPDWKFEKGAYRAYTNAAGGTVPLYRFYSKATQGHFYTISATENAKLMASSPHWKYEGVAYYVYPKSVSGSVPVYRFWSAANRHHFFTASAAERNALRAGGSKWRYEGIAFWALPPGTAKAAAPRAVKKAPVASDEGGAGGEGGASASGSRARSAASRVGVTTSDGSDGSAAIDGDEGTAWTVDAEAGAWVVLSFAAAREVESVEVLGENLPEGMRVLLSEDAEEWFEDEGGTARYVWVAFPAGSGVVTVREVAVLSE